VEYIELLAYNLVCLYCLTKTSMLFYLNRVSKFSSWRCGRLLTKLLLWLNVLVYLCLGVSWWLTNVLFVEILLINTWWFWYKVADRMCDWGVVLLVFLLFAWQWHNSPPQVHLKFLAYEQIIILLIVPPPCLGAQIRWKRVQPKIIAAFHSFYKVFKSILIINNWLVAFYLLLMLSLKLSFS